MGTQETQPMILQFCSESCQDRQKYMPAHNGQLPPCGCGKNHKMLPFGDCIVHWNGRHWVLDCLAEHLLARKIEDEEVIVLLRKRMQKLQGDLATLTCAASKEDAPHQVGKNYRIVGGAAYCPLCDPDACEFGGG